MSHPEVLPKEEVSANQTEHGEPPQRAPLYEAKSAFQQY